MRTFFGKALINFKGNCKRFVEFPASWQMNVISQLPQQNINFNLHALVKLTQSMIKASLQQQGH